MCDRIDPTDQNRNRNVPEIDYEIYRNGSQVVTPKDPPPDSSGEQPKKT